MNTVMDAKKRGRIAHSVMRLGKTFKRKSRQGILKWCPIFWSTNMKDYIPLTVTIELTFYYIVIL
jgi:hypothetical protein